MTTNINDYRRFNLATVSTVTLSIVIALLSYLIIDALLQSIINNVLYAVMVSALLPMMLLAIGAILGKLIKQGINYNPPDWHMRTKQFKIDECETLQGNYYQQYSSFVQNATFWHFMAPVAMIIFDFGVTLYLSSEANHLAWLLPYMNGILQPAILVFSVVMGYRASANAASLDFNLPLIREALHVAYIQSKITAISHTRIALDVGESDNLVIYKNPRVIARIRGIEKHAYIETRSEELGSISKMFIKLHREDSQNDIIWVWSNYDRYFLKMSSPDNEGYYVRYPITSTVKELGVKDIKLVTENAIAIVILEWLRHHPDDEELTKILLDLEVPISKHV